MPEQRWTIFRIDRGEGIEPWTGVKGPATNPPDDLRLTAADWRRSAEIEVIPAAVLDEAVIAAKLKDAIVLDDEDGPVPDSYYRELARNLVAELLSTQPRASRGEEGS